MKKSDGIVSFCPFIFLSTFVTSGCHPTAADGGQKNKAWVTRVD